MNPRPLALLLPLLVAAPLTAGEIPDPLAAADGTVAANAQDWREHVRPGTHQMFREHIYGKRPAPRRSTPSADGLSAYRPGRPLPRNPLHVA